MEYDGEQTPHQRDQQILPVITGHQQSLQCRPSSITTTNIYPKYRQSDLLVNVTVRAAGTSVCCCANLTTARGRRNNALLILSISLLPVLALVVQNAIVVQRNKTSLANGMALKKDVLFSMESGAVIHRMQIERGTSAMYISSGGLSGLEGLNETWTNTDKAIGSLTKWMGSEKDGAKFKSREAFHDSIRSVRLLVKNLSLTVTNNVDIYTADIAVMIDWLANSIQLSQSGSLWPALVGYHMLVVSTDEVGLERALGSTFFTTGRFSCGELSQYLEAKTLGESYLHKFRQYRKASTVIDRNFEGSPLQATIQTMRASILSSVGRHLDVPMAQWWFDNMTLYINMLKSVQDQIGEYIVQNIHGEISTAENDLTISICVMATAIFLFILVLVSVTQLTIRLQSFAATLQDRTIALNAERKKTERLLNELLPPSVASKLVRNQPVEPESFQCVTVFFSDVVGFTAISSLSSPLQMIHMMNILYETFDETLDLYCVYKVETIGDGYMIASGLPVRNEEQHAVEMGELALELRDIVCSMTVPHLPDHHIHIRVGLSSGSVVAGVVGHKMPRYCLFGDTVNVASRMESSGVPNKIQVSMSTFEELTKRGGFVMEERGEMEIKGKGKMTTYFLNGKTTFFARTKRKLSRSVI